MRTDLLTYALNLTAAHEDGPVITAEDAFGAVTLTPLRRALVVTDHRAGQGRRCCTVTSQAGLRAALQPRAPLNHAGLIQGRVISSLGPLAFTLDRRRVEPGDTRLNLRLHDRQIVLAGVTYDDFFTSRGGGRLHSNVPTVVRRVAPHQFDQPNDHVRRVISDLITSLYPQLVTSAAALQAQIEEARAAVRAAEEAVHTAGAHLNVAQAELEALEQRSRELPSADRRV
ncbi:hypothetical protein [Deinococcus multiflagellatus]|uniref:Uncharacterized protein n=1 Tax=Deinococcus multiflagellatus TaxID=1656887 RepID=A0ABW1ZPT4_9DEIO|nr:hypothetical protein [Deinococcus multiflagellatus]MBZ9715828.1 hypothetical protein [Deinococcus multiflagellatus]